MSSPVFYTGGASGADYIWTTHLLKQGYHVKVVTFDDHIGVIPPDAETCKYSDEELNSATRHLVQAACALGKSIPESPYQQKLLKRNFFMIRDADMFLAVAKIIPGERGDQVEGVTAWIVQMYIQYCVESGNPVLAWVFDIARDGWFKYLDGKWVSTPQPRLYTRRITVTGTRNINARGVRIIQSFVKS